MIEKKKYGYINNELLFNIFKNIIHSNKLKKLIKDNYSFVEIKLFTIIRYNIFLIVILFDNKIMIEKEYSIYNLVNMYLEYNNIELKLEALSNNYINNI